MQQAIDFLEESQSLAAIIEPLNDDQLQTETQFMHWTIEDIVGHLHMFNHAAELALSGSDKFQKFFAPMANDLRQGKSLLAVQNIWLGELGSLGGGRLVDTWISGFERACSSFSKADPKQRVSWAGPNMSARSSITARQMETWAHGQAVFDVFGKIRQDKSRLRNIAHMGVSTFGWTFVNRNLDVPSPAPFVRLAAPNGETWEWNDPQDDNRVEGLATEFCQLVTQTRHIDDTDISWEGGIAKDWIHMAQCFAGPPVDGPAKGSRFCVQA